MAIKDEFQRDAEDMDFVCVRCGHPFTELDLGAHIAGIITDRRFRKIQIEGEICTECLKTMWEFSEGGLAAARRRLCLEISLTRQAVEGRYTPPFTTTYTTVCAT